MSDGDQQMKLQSPAAQGLGTPALEDAEMNKMQPLPLSSL